MPHEEIQIDYFIHNLKAQTSDQVLNAIAWKLGRHTHADMTWIADQLRQTEKREPSGIDGGIAIPHLKSTPLTSPCSILVKLELPVDFGASDGQPADIVCALFSPQMDGILHLQRLSRLTRQLRETFLLDKLRVAQSEKEMSALFEVRTGQVLAA